MRARLDAERRREAEAAAPSTTAAENLSSQAADRLRALRASLSRNGGECAAHLWSQSRDEVCLRLVVPAGTRAKQVVLELSQKALVSGASACERLRVTVDGDCVAEGALGGPVVDDEDDWDWTVEDLPLDAGKRRVVAVTLRKVHPADGVVHWWQKALEGGVEVDTDTIAERKTYGVKKGDAKGQESYKTFQQVFAEAEKGFKAKIAGHKPIEIDLGGEGLGADDKGKYLGVEGLEVEDKAPLVLGGETGREW